MKKIIGFIFLMLPSAVWACAGGVIPSQIRNITIWVAAILFLGSILFLVAYSVFYLFAKDKQKKRIIFISLIVSILSFLAILFIYATDRLLCAPTTQF
jgi:hypothetical protein